MATVDNKVSFTSVPLDQTVGKPKKQKAPRRVLHFSDGTLEEYSSDEEDSVDAGPNTMVDPKTLKWLPWVTYYMSVTAKTSLSVAELCGEKLAWLFGITSPKYAYAVEEYKRVAKDSAVEKERVKKLEQEANVNNAFDVTVMKDEGIDQTHQTTSYQGITMTDKY